LMDSSFLFAYMSVCSSFAPIAAPAARSMRIRAIRILLIIFT
jgi:hypothetical protein